MLKGDWKMAKKYSIDDFTLHCMEMKIKELIEQNKRYQQGILDELNPDVTRYLIFENRILVLYEALGELQSLKIKRGDMK